MSDDLRYDASADSSEPADTGDDAASPNDSLPPLPARVAAAAKGTSSASSASIDMGGSPPPPPLPLRVAAAIEGSDDERARARAVADARASSRRIGWARLRHKADDELEGAATDEAVGRRKGPAAGSGIDAGLHSQETEVADAFASPAGPPVDTTSAQDADDDSADLRQPLALSEEEAWLRAEADAAAEAARLRHEADARRAAEAEAARLAEEAAEAERAQVEAETRRVAEEEARRRAEEEERLREHRRLEEEARLRAEEEARIRAELEARLKAEEQARAEAEARRAAAEEALRQVEEAEAARRAAAEAQVAAAAEAAAAAAAAAEAAATETPATQETLVEPLPAEATEDEHSRKWAEAEAAILRAQAEQRERAERAMALRGGAPAEPVRRVERTDDRGKKGSGVSESAPAGDGPVEAPAKRSGSHLNAIRSRLATVIWMVAVFAALVLAVGALCVALKVDFQNNALQGLAALADKLDFGSFKTFAGEMKLDTFLAKVDQVKPEDYPVKTVLMSWGAAAVIWLVVGKILDKLIRP